LHEHRSGAAVVTLKFKLSRKIVAIIFRDNLDLSVTMLSSDVHASGSHTQYYLLRTLMCFVLNVEQLIISCNCSSILWVLFSCNGINSSGV